MPNVPIIMPQLGESIAEATVIAFLANPGDAVKADQDLLEVETNKATLNVTAPCAGTLTEWHIDLQKSYPVGAQLGLLDTTREEAERCGITTHEAPVRPVSSSSLPAAPPPPTPRTPVAAVQPTVRGLPVPAHAAGASYMSPRLRARMSELGLHAADLAGIAGSGAAGRVTIDDFENFIAGLERHHMSPASSMRVAVADAMRRSWTRPIATVGLPCVLDPLLIHRKTLALKPGPALYALRALAVALAENSAIAGRLIGDRIVHPRSIDVGFAVEAEDGVLVPVIREADKIPLESLAERYNYLVERARQRKLPQDASGQSIATVTNFGTFGLKWATPIPLPEQTLVLGLGAGRKTPVWSESEGTFVPVIEAEITLSFDHRVLDGGAAGRLLTRVAALLGMPETL